MKGVFLASIARVSTIREQKTPNRAAFPQVRGRRRRSESCTSVTSMTILALDLGQRVALRAELDLLRPVELLTPDNARDLFLNTKSPNTKKAYSGDLNGWFEWCGLLDVD